MGKNYLLQGWYPYLGTCFAITHLVLANLDKFWIEHQDTIIYRLYMRNYGYDAYLPISIFWIRFVAKNGLAAILAPKGLGPQNPTKKLAHYVYRVGPIC